MRSYSLVLATVLATSSLAATPPDLGKMMPGTLHGGALSDFALLLQDFPGIAHEGWLGEKIDAWVAKGFPDPRALVGQVGLGLNVNITSREVRDVLVLGHGPLRIAHRVREAARRAGVPVKEIPYRGVVFVQPAFVNVPVWVSEVGQQVSHFHWDGEKHFRSSKNLVDTIAGRQVSFGDKHGMSLTPETYAVAGIQIPIAAGAERDLDTAGIHLVVQGSVNWTRSGSRIRLGLELETFTATEAGILARWMTGKVEAWKQSATHPILIQLLEAVRIRRVGKHVFLALVHDFEVAQPGFLAFNQEMADDGFRLAPPVDPVP